VVCDAMHDLMAGNHVPYLVVQSQSDGAYTTLHFPYASSSAALGIDKKGVVVGGYTKDAVRHG